jgi:protein-disulfide isomerase
MARCWLFLFSVLAFMIVALPGVARADGVPPISDEDVVLGKPDAPVTIIEYASLSCPHCAEFEALTWPQVKKEWIETGKARYVFRDFPLNGPAFRASLLARCAARAEFYPFIEELYANQASWVFDDEAATMNALQRIGVVGGVSADRFAACQQDKTLQAKISASEAAAQQAGVDSTPTFFINGTKVAGAMAYSDFVKPLQAAAAAAKTP